MFAFLLGSIYYTYRPMSKQFSMRRVRKSLLIQRLPARANVYNYRNEQTPSCMQCDAPCSFHQPVADGPAKDHPLISSHISFSHFPFFFIFFASISRDCAIIIPRKTTLVEFQNKKICISRQLFLRENYHVFKTITEIFNFATLQFYQIIIHFRDLRETTSEVKNITSN